MSLLEELQPQTAECEGLFVHPSLGAIAEISERRALGEISLMTGSLDPVGMYEKVLAGHDEYAGIALSGILDEVGSNNSKTPADVDLPVAAILRTRASQGRIMAIAGLLHRSSPFETLIAPDPESGDGIWVASAALSLRGFVQTIKGETKAHCARRDQSGLAFIDALRYSPDSDTTSVHVSHSPSIAVASGNAVQEMLDDHGFGVLGRVMEDVLGVSVA